MRVLGIDPGTKHCGFAVLDVDERVEPVVVDVGTFRTEGDETIAARVREVAFDLGKLIREVEPAVICVETPGFGIRDVSAVAKLWAAYGALHGAAQRGPLVFDRTPDSWRKSLGLATSRDLAKRDDLTANARRALYKRQSRDLVRDRFPGILRLLEACPASAREHAFDATAIALAWIASAAPTQLAAIAPRDTHA